jgi:Xaa-Pro aminopeptidase
MAYASTYLLRERLARVRAAIEEQSLDALVVTYLPNIFYLTNFTGSAGIAVVARDRLLFITDFRYAEAVGVSFQSAEAPPDATVHHVRGSYDETLASVLAGLDDRARIGFEADRVPVSRHQWLCSALGREAAPPELIPALQIVEKQRSRKDTHELKTLRQAGELISEVAGEAIAAARAGRLEREVAADIDWLMRRSGFERPAFDTIVASGPNSALPHARAGDRRLEPGDLVMLDFGGVYDGYCVDLTRTISLGAADDEVRRVYRAVAEAQDAAMAAVRPGVLASSVDAAAREVLARHRLGEAFGHGTGHGLGIEVHEGPRIAPAREKAPAGIQGAPDDEVLEVGMVFTIEPGAYLPGWGGVRIEDDVVVTPDGCESVTRVPRQLHVG